MAPQLLKHFFRIGIFLTITSLLLAVANKPGSAEFVISIVSAVIGVVLLLLVWLVAWWLNRG